MKRAAFALLTMLAADAAQAQPYPRGGAADPPRGYPGGYSDEPRYMRPYRGPADNEPEPYVRRDRDDRADWREPYRSAPDYRQDYRYDQRQQYPVYPDRRRPAVEPDDDEPPRRAPQARDQEPQRGYAPSDGGPRPDIRPVAPETAYYSGKYAPGTIIIETSGRQLLLVVSKREALRYPISVGRQGFTWTGTEKISRIAEWPDWHPPEQMRERDPKLPEKMSGGIRNPLGAKALYLGDTLYRIHGTNDARTIGYASSSGCFRMLNGHVVDLASRVRVGAAVVVIDRLPRDVVAPYAGNERRVPYRY